LASKSFFKAKNEGKYEEDIYNLTCNYLSFVSLGYSCFFVLGKQSKKLIPQNGAVKIPIAGIIDGKAHFFKVKANDGIMVSLISSFCRKTDRTLI